MRFLKLAGIAILVGLLAVPTAALAAGDDGPDTDAPSQTARNHSDDAPPPPEASHRHHPDAPDAHGRPDGHETTETESSETVSDTEGPGNGHRHGTHVPTGRAQEVLANLVSSGKLPPQAAEVLFRVLEMLEEKHGAVVPLPAEPCSTCTGGPR
jgi:hypothetical protein